MKMETQVSSAPRSQWIIRASGQQGRDQTEFLEIVRHLVDNPRLPRGVRRRKVEIFLSKLLCSLRLHRRDVVQELGIGAGFQAELLRNRRHMDEFARAKDVRVAGADLFDQGGSRTRHADDEDRAVRVETDFPPAPRRSRG
jgi:hypothetical protein